jgi:lysophospholipase L1-like esterase
MKKILAISILLICSSTFSLLAQNKPAFLDDVQTIKNYDKIYEPPIDPVLFIGSSSIRKWPDIQKDFCNHTVVNRGIGGAVINDIIYYADDIIFPYHPKQIIIYVGENDVPDEQTTADSIFLRFKNLYTLLRSKLPSIPIDYIAIKPSPSRVQFLEKAKRANALISSFLKKESNAAFINIFDKMISKEGKPRPELFVNDMLHMNTAGYEIWRKAVKPYLL